MQNDAPQNTSGSPSAINLCESDARSLRYILDNKAFELLSRPLMSIKHLFWRGFVQETYSYETDHHGKAREISITSAGRAKLYEWEVDHAK